MLGVELKPKRFGDAEVAYSLLRKATFGALIYALIYLQIAIQPLWIDPSAPIPPMSPAEAAASLVGSVGLLILPLIILFLFGFGYHGLVYHAMAGLPARPRESIWKARLFFQAFWIIIGLAVLFFFGTIGAAALGAPEIVRLAMYLPVGALAPSGLLIAYILFLGYSVWEMMPASGRLLLQRLVWAEVILVGASGIGIATLTALSWREIEASGTIATVYSPWTTIPSSALTVVTLVALYLAFRRVRHYLPSRESPGVAPLAASGVQDLR